MLSRFRMIVGRHCRSIGLVIHAHRLAPGGEMARKQAFHLRECTRHIKLHKLRTWSGDMAGAGAVVQRTRADLETDPRKQGKHLAAASLSDQLARKNYDVARFHKAKATRQFKLALGRPNL